MNGEILVPWAVLILTIGDVFGMWSKNHAKMRGSYAEMAQNIAKTCKTHEMLFDKLQKSGVPSGVYYTIYPRREMSIFAPSPLRKRIFAGIFADPQKFCKNFCAGSISIIFRILGGAGFYEFKLVVIFLGGYRMWTGSFAIFTTLLFRILSTWNLHCLAVRFVFRTVNFFILPLWPGGGSVAPQKRHFEP